MRGYSNRSKLLQQRHKLQRSLIKMKRSKLRRKLKPSRTMGRKANSLAARNRMLSSINKDRLSEGFTKFPRSIAITSRAANNYVTDLYLSLKSMDSSAQLDLWKKMIATHYFNIDQLISLRTAIEDKIRIDIVSRVPYHIAIYIMSCLDAQDIARAAQTCRSWRVVCEDTRLWREKCREEGLLEDHQALSVLFKQRIATSHAHQEKFVIKSLSSAPKTVWKTAYLKHINIIRNWRTRNFKFPQSVPLSMDDYDIKIMPGPKNLSLVQGPRSSSSKKVSLLTKPEAKANPNLITKSAYAEGAPSSAYSDSEMFSDDIHVTQTKISDPHLMTLKCHEDSVITCLQYNPASNIIVSGSDDMTLKVWSSETGECIHTLKGHAGGVWSSQLSPEDIVVSGSTDRTLKVWNAKTGRLMHTLEGHMSTVRCLALDGTKVVSGSRDTTLRLWDIIEGECLNVYVGHGSAVRCVEYKNNIIVSGAYDHLVIVWDALTGSLLHPLDGHTNRIYSLQFDGKTIASGSLDTSICIWDLATGKLRHRLEGHTSLTSKMQMKGDLLVSANADSYCKVWNIKTGQCLRTLGGDEGHKSAITSVYFNGDHVVTSSDDGTVKLWDIKTGNFIRDLIVQTLPTVVVWRIRASYTKLIAAVGSRNDTADTQLHVLNFNDE